jgi:hypothetical protein
VPINPSRLPDRVGNAVQPAGGKHDIICCYNTMFRVLYDIVNKMG